MPKLPKHLCWLNLPNFAYVSPACKIGATFVVRAVRDLAVKVMLFVQRLMRLGRSPSEPHKILTKKQTFFTIQI